MCLKRFYFHTNQVILVEMSNKSKNVLNYSNNLNNRPVSWAYKIRRLQIYRGVRHPQITKLCSGYETICW